MPGTLQPLDQKFAIVDGRGNPTEYFTRWAQQKQIDIGDSITLTDLQAYLTAHKLIPGTGIQLTPDGDINDGVTIHADVQAILDEVTATRGAVLYRGLLGWAALLPGTAGLFLQTSGAGADPVWAAGGGGGGGTTPTVRATNILGFNNSTATITLPVGTIAGDVVLLFASNGWNVINIAGWTVFDNQAGSSTNGAILGKVMTAADITAGSVTVTFGSSYYGIVALMTVTGTTTIGVRGTTAVRNSSGVSSLVFTSGVPFLPTDLILVYVSNRGNSTNTMTNVTVKQTNSQADASGMIGVYSGTLGKLGFSSFSETANFSVAGSGNYVGVIGLR